MHEVDRGREGGSEGREECKNCFRESFVPLPTLTPVAMHDVALAMWKRWGFRQDIKYLVKEWDNSTAIANRGFLTQSMYV